MACTNTDGGGTELGRVQMVQGHAQTMRHFSQMDTVTKRIRFLSNWIKLVAPSDA